MHKSKENPNGTFSIGKTWFLDDLSGIESFTSPTCNPQFQQWAGDCGFIVVLGKPYYWQAQTDKEKKFFIASLIKIYSKYTGGRTPNLTGFDQRELDQVLGGAQASRRQERPPPPRPGPPETTPSSGNVSISSGYNGSLNMATPTAASFAERGPSRSPMMSNGGGRASPARSVESVRPSNDQASSLRRLATNNQSQDSVANSMATRSDDANSLRPRSRNGVANGGSNYPGPSPVPVPVPVPVPAPRPTEERPPERKRPPMDPLRPLQADRDLVPAPLMSPGMRREPIVPPRSMSRVSPRKNSTNRRPEPVALGDALSQDDSKADPPVGGPSPSVGTPVSLNSAISAPPPPPAPVDTPVESPVEPEEARPGLVPMIKSKKSRGEIAGQFRKMAAAATAVSAFKPRPGGAAERLRQNQNKSSDGPDGITGVVPAPPRPTSAQKAAEATPAPAPVAALQAKAGDRNSGNSIPEVKVTVSGSGSRPSSLQSSLKDKKVVEDAAEEEERRAIVAGNDSKYLATLGIDPSILNNKTAEFAKWLDYFGWVPGEQMRARNFDEMRIDIDRELNKAQAGGWLARFQEEDERVEAIKRGVDVAIEECEELDNLLTLYSVELSVGLSPPSSGPCPDANRAIDTRGRHCIYRGPGTGSSGTDGESEITEKGTRVSIADLRH